jgi:hypothetical protein
MLVRLYILGDFLDDAKFCNKVMDIVTPSSHARGAWSHWGLDAASLNLSWAKTSAGSPLRSALLETLTYNIFHGEGKFQKLVEGHVTTELFLDLFQHLENKLGLMTLLKPSTNSSKLSTGCAFHRHDEENPKCSES